MEIVFSLSERYFQIDPEFTSFRSAHCILAQGQKKKKRILHEAKTVVSILYVCKFTCVFPH